jgi:hypothetical protein
MLFSAKKNKNIKIPKKIQQTKLMTNKTSTVRPSKKTAYFFVFYPIRKGTKREGLERGVGKCCLPTLVGEGKREVHWKTTLFGFVVRSLIFVPQNVIF